MIPGHSSNPTGVNGVLTNPSRIDSKDLILVVRGDFYPKLRHFFYSVGVTLLDKHFDAL